MLSPPCAPGWTAGRGRTAGGPRGPDTVQRASDGAPSAEPDAVRVERRVAWGVPGSGVPGSGRAYVRPSTATDAASAISSSLGSSSFSFRWERTAMTMGSESGGHTTAMSPRAP